MRAQKIITAAAAVIATAVAAVIAAAVTAVIATAVIAVIAATVTAVIAVIAAAATPLLHRTGAPDGRARDGRAWVSLKSRGEASGCARAMCTPALLLPPQKQKIIIAVAAVIPTAVIAVIAAGVTAVIAVITTAVIAVIAVTSWASLSSRGSLAPHMGSVHGTAIVE